MWLVLLNDQIEHQYYSMELVLIVIVELHLKRLNYSFLGRA